MTTRNTNTLVRITREAADRSWRLRPLGAVVSGLAFLPYWFVLAWRAVQGRRVRAVGDECLAAAKPCP
jgi:hypothetical protein